MNENIKNLFNICGMPNEDIMELFEDKNKTFYMEKFANLIIQECIKRIEGTSAPLIENMDSAQNYGYAQWWEGYDDRGADSIECIKKHFGVE